MYNLEEIYSIHQKIKHKIENRILEFKNIWEKGTEQEFFLELAFCLFTPQSKALNADKALKNIIQKGLLYCNDEKLISNELNIVRFKNKKAKFFILARDKFLNNLKKIINPKDIHSTRDYLVNNVVGYGYKEASHFLRNIGFVEDIAILDRHILKNLLSFNIISKLPKNLSKKNYYEIEKLFKKFSITINIPLSHLDFVFWYKEAKEVFK